MEQLHQISKIAFASEFSFALKAQNFHWNVEGMFFQQFHALFEEIYRETYGSIDDFAENIRKLGAYAPASLSRFNMLTQIEDESEMLSAEDMVKELLMDNEKMIVILKKTFAASEAAGEPGFSDFIAGRIDGHRKHGWMLRATLKGKSQ
jgi:starvation-inducible DNA-binding protein